MTYYAHYDPTAPSPAPITGWINTFAHTYKDLDLSKLLELTAEQWEAHAANPSGWAVSDGVPVPYTRPAASKTLAQQARAMLGAGVAITTTGGLTLPAAVVLPTGLPARQQMSTMMAAIPKLGGFPGGVPTWPVQDASGRWHDLTMRQYQAVAAALLGHIAHLDLIIAGHPQHTSLPPASVTVVV